MRQYFDCQKMKIKLKLGMALFSKKITQNTENKRDSLSSLLGTCYFDDSLIAQMIECQKEITKEVTIRHQAQWIGKFYQSSVPLLYYYGNFYNWSYFYLKFSENAYVLDHQEEVIFRLYKTRILDIQRLDVFIYSFLNENTESDFTDVYEKNNDVKITMQIQMGMETQKLYNSYVNNEITENEVSKMLSASYVLLNPKSNIDVTILETEYWDLVKSLNSPYEDLIKLNYLKFKKSRNLNDLLSIFREVNVNNRPSIFSKAIFKIKLAIFNFKGKYG